MARIAVIGICGNSVFLTADHFHENGETLIANETFEEVGGKGFNQAITTVKLGATVDFLAAIGDDANGAACQQAAAQYGLSAHFCVKSGKRTPFAFILTDRHGENRVTEYKDAELSPDDVLAFEPCIADADILLLQHEVPAAVNDAAIRIAKKHGVKVILNPAPIREVSDDTARAVFAVTPNEQEAAAIDPSRFQNCITTLGKRGCCIAPDTMIDGLTVTAVDTTGAGDTFNGALAVSLANGNDLPTACRFAITAAGLSVTKRGVLAAIPTLEDVERSLPI